MKIIHRPITSLRTDMYAVATLGAFCIVLAIVLPTIWSIPSVVAGVINLINAKRLQAKLLNANR